MVKMNHILTFTLVVEYNSFIGAAKYLNVSKATVSKQIADLESELGAQLLTRTTRRIALTDVGQAYYNHCKSVLAQLDEGHKIIDQMNDEPVGQLNIHSGTVFANTFLLPHINKFIKAHDKLSISLYISDRKPDINKEEIDILIGVSNKTEISLSRRKLHDVRHILCAAPGFIKKHGEPHLPHDIVNYPFVGHTSRGNPNPILFKNDEKVYVKPTLMVNTSYAMTKATIEGVGLGWLQEENSYVQKSIKKGKLVELLPKNREPTFPLYAYYRESDAKQPKVITFLDFITQLVKK
tara:strand:+ start:22827 stop:23708 length:882 start_codon:yes stop_codon:yes gene_type:complete